MAATLKFNQLSHHSDKKWSRESRDSQGEIQGYTGMYPTTVMHTDNCTQHMNTYLKMGVRRDSGGCPMVMESQSYNRLHLEKYVWQSDWICHQFRSRKGDYIHCLATDLWYSFCFQSAILLYHILIKRNVLVCLLSSLNLPFSFIQYFLTQSFFLPISLASHHLLFFFYSFLPQWTVGYQALLGGLWALN